MLRCWDWVGYISTGLVFVGVVGESLIELTKWVKSPELTKQIGAASALILILGLAGELISTVKISAVTGEITAILNKEAADAQLSAEHEKLARIKLESSLGRRTISEKQREIIEGKLSRFKGIAVDLFIFDGDEWTRFENITFARVIASTLDKAGMDVRGYFGMGCGLSLQPLIGVGVTGSPRGRRQEREASTAIANALQAAGVQMAYFPHPMPKCEMFSNLFPGTQKPEKHWANITIMVGNKPPVILGRPTVQSLINSVKPIEK